MAKIYFEKKETSEFVRYKEGLWISHRKRVFLYWFKFLQEAEKSDEYQVDWRKYKGWGSANYILGSKFDDFWNENWKSLFGVKNRDKEQPKFKTASSRVKTEGIRLALLCWQKRHAKSALAIAKQVYEYEMGISGEKKARYTEDEHGASNLNVDGLDAEGYEMDKQRLQMYVGRYITNAKGYLKNVCIGVFPKSDRK